MQRRGFAGGVALHMRKHHVAVLMGGISSEHDVSVKTGAMVVGSIDRDKFNVTPITITRNGKWKLLGTPAIDVHEALPQLMALRIDCVFLALHGPFGEDGRIQGMFDMLGIPYTGPGCAASALAMDKIRSKAVVSQAGVPVARHEIITRREWDSVPHETIARITTQIGFPCVIKSPCQGSSIGMAIPDTAEHFESALLDVLSYGDTVLVEEFLEGVELTCGVMDVAPGGRPWALPVTEIRPLTSKFFDYAAKYDPGASEEITPARIPEDMTGLVQEYAVKAHDALGCRGLSRSDMILSDRGPVWFELNTIPGMTETSLFPQAAAVAGISFPVLIERLVLGAIAFAENAQNNS